MRKLLVSLLVLTATGGAALADDAKPSKEQVAQAKKLYTAAEAEVRIGKFAEAAKDYTAAYELTKDPALLFKIASAHQNAGACDSAVPYYRQYLKEATPTPKYVDLTKDRIAKCGAPLDEPAAPPPAPPPVVEATRPEPPAAAPPATPPPAPAPAPVAPPHPVEAEPTIEPGHARDKAWAFVGGAALLGSVGVALYADGRNGGSSTSKDLGYASLGLGGVSAIAAVYFFVRHQPQAESAALLVPTATAHGAGLAALFRF